MIEHPPDDAPRDPGEPETGSDPPPKRPRDPGVHETHRKEWDRDVPRDPGEYDTSNEPADNDQH